MESWCAGARLDGDASKRPARSGRSPSRYPRCRRGRGQRAGCVPRSRPTPTRNPASLARCAPHHLKPKPSNTHTTFARYSSSASKSPRPHQNQTSDRLPGKNRRATFRGCLEVAGARTHIAGIDRDPRAIRPLTSGRCTSNARTARRRLTVAAGTCAFLNPMQPIADLLGLAETEDPRRCARIRCFPSRPEMCPAECRARRRRFQQGCPTAGQQVSSSPSGALTAAPASIPGQRCAPAARSPVRTFFTAIEGTEGARIWTGHGILAHSLVKISALAVPRYRAAEVRCARRRAVQRAHGTQDRRATGPAPRSSGVREGGGRAKR